MTVIASDPVGQAYGEKKAEARDKVGRIEQYGGRAFLGMIDHTPTSSPLQPWLPIVAEVQMALARARGTHR